MKNACQMWRKHLSLTSQGPTFCGSYLLQKPGSLQAKKLYLRTNDSIVGENSESTTIYLRKHTRELGPHLSLPTPGGPQASHSLYCTGSFCLCLSWLACERLLVQTTSSLQITCVLTREEVTERTWQQVGLGAGPRHSEAPPSPLAMSFLPTQSTWGAGFKDAACREQCELRPSGWCTPQHPVDPHINLEDSGWVGGVQRSIHLSAPQDRPRK